ncbi:MAG: ATP-binding protein [Candidatus Moraniibacteriota bacterium]|nr:MAG: ATP-binding protein [Candidatus Moranbacteria bacterium]
MSKLIVVCGLPGSGKTTLAAELSRKLHIVCLHKDAIKERLYDFLDGKTLEESKLFGRISIQLLLAIGEDMVRNGVDIILESPFNHPDNPKTFKRWIDEYGVEVKSIVCLVHTEERMRRMRERPRHDAHHDQKRLELKTNFGDEDFDYECIPGRKIFLDTSVSHEEILGKAMSFLGDS